MTEFSGDEQVADSAVDVNAAVNESFPRDNGGAGE